MGMAKHPTMEAKETLKAHIAKIAKLKDEQFDYYFSHFEKQHFKKGQVFIISAGDTGGPPVLRGLRLPEVLLYQRGYENVHPAIRNAYLVDFRFQRAL